jgi:DNA-binding XRE family transcriptional regulator
MTPEELRKLRIELGWTQAGAAKWLGMGHRNYKYIEQGVSSTGVPTPEVSTPVAVAMLAFQLLAAIEVANHPLMTALRLADFHRAVRALSSGPTTRKKRSSAKKTGSKTRREPAPPSTTETDNA